MRNIHCFYFSRFCATVYFTTKQSSFVSRDGLRESECYARRIHPAKVQPERKREKLDMRLSGSAIIDEILHEMIDYILRDYIHHWYDHISDDDQFIYELRKTIQETLVNLSSRYAQFSQFSVTKLTRV